MEERNKVMPIFKSDNPEELVVFHAASLQDEIRFYFNDTQYVTAIDCGEGYTIKIEKEIDEECNKKDKVSIIKENVQKITKKISLICGVSIIGIIGVLCLGKKIDNILVFLIIMNIIYFIIDILYVVLMEAMETTIELKSKHSAEHMMINFLTTNKRLPKSIEEVKIYSRFSSECGSRELVKDSVEELIRSIVSIIFTVNVNGIVSYFFSSAVTNVVVFLSIYFLVKFIVGKIITMYGVLNFIVEPIKIVLTNIVQCANTTSKVKDRDIILAYAVAKVWLQVVYPEFYNKDEDVFWKKYKYKKLIIRRV